MIYIMYIYIIYIYMYNIYMHIYIYIYITQTVLHCRVPGGVCYGRALGATPPFWLCVRARTV